jgi:hypothetical protein
VRKHWVPGHFEGLRWVKGHWVQGHWVKGHWVKGHYNPKEEPLLTFLLAIFLLILIAGLLG